MLMIDVRNAITRILDKYTLGDVVDVTLRKIKRDGLPAPFGIAPIALPVAVEKPAGTRADPRDGLVAFLHLHEDEK
jgi:hypothetical protein